MTVSSRRSYDGVTISITVAKYWQIDQAGPNRARCLERKQSDLSGHG